MSSPALKHAIRPLPKPWLGVLAVLFAVSAIVYAGFWLYSAELSIPISGEDRAILGFNSQYIGAEHVFLVRRVPPGGFAERAGIKVGDRIVAIFGKPVEASTGVRLGRQHKPGDSVEISIRRPGVPDTITIHTIFLSRNQARGSVVASRLAQFLNNFFPVGWIIVGLAVLFSRMRDPNAWLMALVFCGIVATAPFYDFLDVPAWIRPWIIVYRSVFDNLFTPLFYFFFAVFPERSPLDRLASWLKWFALTVGAAFALVALQDFGHSITRFGSTTGTTEELRLVFNCAMMILGMVSLVWSAVSPTSAEARRKTRVILWGTLIGILPMTLVTGVSDFVGFDSFWIFTIAIFLFWLLPLSFAYAVVKHRVLEIPVLLRRSARYLLVQRGFVFLLMLLSAGITIAFALLFARYLQAHAAALPGGITLGTVFGTVLFWTGAKVHKDVGRRIDRAFFRSAYDARMILEDLVEKTRTATDRKDLAALLDRRLKAALQPGFLIVYFETGKERLAAVAGEALPECQTISPADDSLRQLAQHGLPREIPGNAGDKASCPISLLALHAECLVPILGRDNRLAGLIVLGMRLSEEPYSAEDKNLLAAVANQVGVALESIRLGEKIAERIEAERRVAQEMEFARQVQSRLFPQKLPCMKTLEFTGACNQALTVGGDYYDFLELCPGRLALVLADIAGKGVPGALLMANLQANLRSQYAMAIDDLPRLLASVNHLFCQSTSSASYATLFFADYDDATHLLRYANCGHLPALLLHANGSPQAAGAEVEWLSATHTVLGMFEDWKCETAEVRLALGDTLLLYTDGITEATNSDGEEFGEVRLLEMMRSQFHLPVQQLMESIISAVRQFSGAEQVDDVTLIVARCSAQANTNN